MRPTTDEGCGAAGGAGGLMSEVLASLDACGDISVCGTNRAENGCIKTRKRNEINQARRGHYVMPVERADVDWDGRDERTVTSP